MEEIVFKISGANKNVKLNFNNIDNAKKYIVDKKLYPTGSNEDIVIIETKFHKILSNKPILSLEIKQNIMSIIEEQFILKNVIIDDVYILHFMKEWGDEKNFMYDILVNIIKNMFNITDQDISESLKRVYEEFNFNDEIAQKIIKKANEIFSDLVLQIFLIFKNNKDNFTFHKIKTDYKPSDAILVMFDNKIGFQIRKEDILIGPTYGYGRNVNTKKINALCDEDFLTFNSEHIKIKK